MDISTTTREQREHISETFFPGTGESYDRVVARTTLGLDRRWKDAMMASLDPEAGRILDLACGTGIVLNRLHQRCPKAALVGVDITEDYLAIARTRFEDSDLDLTLMHTNAEDMQLEGTFDAVVSSYIPKYVDPDIILERIAPHVYSGTRLAFQDFAHPRGFVPRQLWKGWMRGLKWFGPRIWPTWKVVFEENLEELIRTSRWRRTYIEALERHGWTDVQRKNLHWRTACLITARRP